MESFVIAVVDLQRRFLATLSKAQEQRERLPMNEWIALERQTMLEAVNEYRLSHGAQPVNVDEISRVEQFAVGHVDYSSKLALYCAELALGVRSNP